jgi:pyruvate formate lyase activating enzyme
MNENHQQTLKATIFEVQRMSTEDGPGIRTTVFFKGCGLQCAWCHNPESISPKPQMHWIGNRCIGCKTCLKVCPENALAFTAAGNRIDRKLCTGCGLCGEECPAGALELIGKQWTLHDLTAEVLKDRTYFEKSGGGITLGGGEPTLQATFCRDFLKRLKEQAIHTALDTCGLCAQNSLAELLPFTDLLLYDIKEIDSKRHRYFTGSPNEKILCAFNNLCRDKYLRLDMDWDFKATELLGKSFMEKMAAVARNSGIDPAIVHWSGSTRLAVNNTPNEQGIEL